MILRAPGACSPTPQARQQQYRCATFDPGFLRISERLHQSGRRLCATKSTRSCCHKPCYIFEAFILAQEAAATELRVVTRRRRAFLDRPISMPRPNLPSLFGHIWQTQARSIMFAVISGYVFAIPVVEMTSSFLRLAAI